MSAQRKQRLLSLHAYVFAFGALVERRAWAQVPEEKSAGSASLVRPCVTRKESSKSARKDKAKGKGTADSEEAVMACLEAKDSALNIQEFFQSYLHAQGWRFGEERILADGSLPASSTKTSFCNSPGRGLLPVVSPGPKARPSFWWPLANWTTASRASKSPLVCRASDKMWTALLRQETPGTWSQAASWKKI
jgi:hypothetical protein